MSKTLRSGFERSREPKPPAADSLRAAYDQQVRDLIPRLPQINTLEELKEYFKKASSDVELEAVWLAGSYNTLVEPLEEGKDHWDKFVHLWCDARAERRKRMLEKRQQMLAKKRREGKGKGGAGEELIGVEEQH